MSDDTVEPGSISMDSMESNSVSSKAASWMVLVSRKTHMEVAKIKTARAHADVENRRDVIGFILESNELAFGLCVCGGRDRV